MITSELIGTNDWLVVDVDEDWVKLSKTDKKARKRTKTCALKIFGLLSYWRVRGNFMKFKESSQELRRHEMASIRQSYGEGKYQTDYQSWSRERVLPLSSLR